MSGNDESTSLFYSMVLPNHRNIESFRLQNTLKIPKSTKC